MPDGSWNVDAAGNWSDTTRWLNGIVPNGVGSVANITNNITYGNAGRVVVNGAYTIGSLYIADNNGFGLDRTTTYSGAGSLTLDNGANKPIISYATEAWFSCPLVGTNGFVLKSPGWVWKSTFLPAVINSSLTGEIEVESGILGLGNRGDGGGTPNVFPNISSYFLTGGEVRVMGDLPATITQSLRGSTGYILLENDQWITFSGDNSNYSAGFYGYSQVMTSFGEGRNCIFTSAQSLPPTFSSLQTQSLNNSTTNNTSWLRIVYSGTTNGINTATKYFVASQYGGATTAHVQRFWFENTSSNSSLLTLSGDYYESGAGHRSTTTRTLQFDCTSGPIAHFGNFSAPSIGTNFLTKNGSHRLTLSGSIQSNGQTNINAGFLTVLTNDALGNNTSSAVVFGSGAVFDLSGTRNINKGVTPLTLTSNTINTEADTGANSYTCGGVTLSAGNTTINVASGSSFSFVNSGAIIGSGIGFVKNGEGELILPTASNTFTGNITVNSGSLTVGSISNPGSPSSWGAGSGVINVPKTLKINGTGGSTTRTINLSGITSTIDSSGTNPVTFSSVTQSSGYRVIALDGTNAGNNTISAPIGNGSVGSSTQIAKNGSGKWKLTGALTYTGITEVNEGTLNIGSISQNFANDVTLSPGTRLESDPGGSCSGTFYCTGAQIYTSLNTFSVTLNGASEISGVLSGNGVVYVSSGTTTIETPSTNTYSGTSTIDSGSVVVAHTLQNPSSSGTGKVFGNSALSVNGTLKTGSSANQQGKVRYGGNISFGPGAQIHIGGA